MERLIMDLMAYRRQTQSWTLDKTRGTYVRLSGTHTATARLKDRF